jgi:hypothetical protein
MAEAATPKDYIIAIIVFGMIITGTMSLIGMFYEQDVNFIEPDKYQAFNESFNIKSDIDTSVQNIKDSIITQSLPSPIDFIATMFLTAFQSMMSLFNSLSFMAAVFDGLYLVFGIPIWVSTGITGIITIMLVFAILGAILQRNV